MRLRKPIILNQLTVGYFSFNSLGSLFAAYPIISKLRITASNVLESCMKVSYVSPRVYLLIFSTASKISARRSFGLRLDIV
jgi:hypothetical protein